MTDRNIPKQKEVSKNVSVHPKKISLLCNQNPYLKGELANVTIVTIVVGQIVPISIIVILKVHDSVVGPSVRLVTRNPVGEVKA